jgi:YVTN family beta-propeller protein
MQKETKQLNMAKANLSFLFGVLLVVVLSSSSTIGQHYGYISNMGVFGDPNNNDLSVIDLATNTVVATVPVGVNPQGVTINPAGTAVYVANTGSNDFTVIDTTTYEATTTSGPGGIGASGAVVHPDGTRIYIANPDWMTGGLESSVWVLDRATNTIVDEISCGKGSCGVVVHPNGKVAYVTNAFAGTIAVFDTDTHEVIDTIVLETVDPNEVSFPVPIIVHPAGTYVYAANRQGPSFWAVDTATHEFITLAIGHSHVGIGVNPRGTAVYLPDMHDRDPNLPPQGTTVDVIDTKTLQVIGTIQDVNAPVDVAVHPDGTRIYVTNSESNTVSVVDTTTYAHIATVAVGTSPNAYGDFIGPGVPRLLKEDAVARLEAVKATIEGGTDGVSKPEQAIKYIESALTSGDLSLRWYLWSATSSEEIDSRRLDTSLGDMVFWSDETIVEAVIDAIRRGWILNEELRSELLAIIDEAVRADRVLVAVAIDDAIVAVADPEKIAEAQEVLENGDALVKQAAAEQGFDRKVSLLQDAINQYRNAWGVAVNLIE